MSGSLRSTAPWRVLDGFGSSRRAVSRCVTPRSLEELAALLKQAHQERLHVSFRGNGRSYGDASLNQGGLAIDNRGMARVLSFDPGTGVIEAQPGATIEDIWRTGLPHGYWPHVVPGTMHPTLGGCVAMNIHGKNCFKVGPFGDHVSELDLMTPDGGLRTLTREHEGELFRATIAGLGLLGAVTRVKLQLKKIESGRLRVRPIRTRTLGEMFDCFVERMPNADYLVGWLDCFATGAALGRGLVHQADYVSAAEDPQGVSHLDPARQGLPPSVMGVPRSLVWRFMKPFTNDLGMRLVNDIKYRLPETFESSGTFLEGHVAFAFLLDYVPNWRNAYGDAGFIQYQLFLPDATARKGMAEALALCQKRGVISYLGVFKRHRPDEYLLSHGLDGWSLALDFAVPSQPQRLWDLCRELTALVLDAGGTFYPAKDQIVDAASFAQAFGPRLERFLELKQSLDPEGLFSSDLARRLGLAPATPGR
ncbi:MAG: FAD-binding oxidoreductase [Candidatus Eisenbacteria bacterium]